MIAGGLAGAITCPLDVLKTRLMLETKNKEAGIVSMAKEIWRESNGNIGAFFKGVGPRTGWISVGGLIFFGAYEKAQITLRSIGMN